MQEIQIMNTMPEDAMGTTEVYYKTWLETYPNKELGITRQDIEDSYKDSFSEERIKNLQKRIQDLPSNERRIVARHGGVIVGVATMVKNENNNQLKTIYVLPEFQGKGIGTMLWNEIKTFSDRMKDTIVHVATYNQKAIGFYKKIGFVDTGKRFSEDRFTFKNGVKLPEMEMILKDKHV